jgi:hypothetical protein
MTGRVRDDELPRWLIRIMIGLVFAAFLAAAVVLIWAVVAIVSWVTR